LSSQAGTVRSRLLSLAGLVFVAVSLYFVGNSLSKGIRESGGLENLLDFDPAMLVLSFLMLQLHFLACGLAWKMVARHTGGRLGLWKAYAIHFLAQVGKYVPGMVWSAIGKFALSRDSGMTGVQTGHALVLETVFIVFGCLFVAMPLVSDAALAVGLSGTEAILLAVAIGLLTLAAAHPVVFGFLVGLAGRVTGKRIEAQRVPFVEILKTIPVYVSIFLFVGLGFWLLALGFGLEIPFFPGVFLYPTAFGVGYLVVLAPGGLGVRELVLVWLIRMAAPGSEPGMAELVAVAARIWITLGEGFAFLISLAIYGKGTRSMIRLLSKKESVTT
jgi:hypothetical protein